MRLLPRPLGLLPGPAAFFLETFHSLHLLFRFAAQGVDLSIDFLLRAGWRPLVRRSAQMDSIIFQNRSGWTGSATGRTVTCTGPGGSLTF